MPKNPILEEIYSARKKLLDDAGGDLHRYIQEANARALASGRPMVGPNARAGDQVKKAPPDQGDSLDDSPPKP